MGARHYGEAVSFLAFASGPSQSRGVSLQTEFLEFKASPIQGAGGYDLEDYREHACRCGAVNCVGFIVAGECFDWLRARHLRS